MDYSKMDNTSKKNPSFEHSYENNRRILSRDNLEQIEQIFKDGYEKPGLKGIYRGASIYLEKEPNPHWFEYCIEAYYQGKKIFEGVCRDQKESGVSDALAAMDTVDELLSKIQQESGDLN